MCVVGGLDWFLWIGFYGLVFMDWLIDAA